MVICGGAGGGALRTIPAFSHPELCIWCDVDDDRENDYDHESIDEDEQDDDDEGYDDDDGEGYDFYK